MSISSIETAEASILARVIAPDEASLPPVVALEMLKWGFPDTDQQRMNELDAKARQGTLTAEEQASLEAYERVGSLLGLVKSKAQRSLQNWPQPAPANGFATQTAEAPATTDPLTDGRAPEWTTPTDAAFLEAAQETFEQYKDVLRRLA